MMRALTVVTAAAGITAASLAASGAVDAKDTSENAAQPTISRVSPMRVTVGHTITIRGAGFSSSRTRNTIILKGAAGRSTFAKPSRASSTKLVVTVPAAAELILTKKAAAGVPTRVSLRVVAKRYGKVSIRRHSPIVVSAR